MEILSEIKGRHMTNFMMSLIKNKECIAICYDSRSCILYLRDHRVPSGRGLDGQYLLLRLKMARVLLVERPLKMPQLMLVHRSPVQHPLRLMVDVRDVLEVDSSVVESGGLDRARIA